MSEYLYESARIQCSKNKLGEGGFGVVYRGLFDGKKVAIKVVNVRDDEQHFIRKRDFLRDFPHRNILMLMHFEEIPQVKRYFSINDLNLIILVRYFVFELCAASLQEWANGRYTGTIPSEMAGLHHMASGLAFVHSKRHVHCNIYPRNILISSNGDRLIISDFGLVKKVHESGSFSAFMEWKNGSLLNAFEMI